MPSSLPPVAVRDEEPCYYYHALFFRGSRCEQETEVRLMALQVLREKVEKYLLMYEVRACFIQSSMFCAGTPHREMYSRLVDSYAIFYGSYLHVFY